MALKAAANPFCYCCMFQGKKMWKKAKRKLNRQKAKKYLMKENRIDKSNDAVSK